MKKKSDHLTTKRRWFGWLISPFCILNVQNKIFQSIKSSSLPLIVQSLDYMLDDHVAFVCVNYPIEIDHEEHSQLSKNKTLFKINQFHFLTYIDRYFIILKFFSEINSLVRIHNHLKKLFGFFTCFLWSFTTIYHPIINHISKIFRCNNIFLSKNTLTTNKKFRNCESIYLYTWWIAWWTKSL